jgi:hypothetical protein
MKLIFRHYNNNHMIKKVLAGVGIFVPRKGDLVTLEGRDYIVETIKYDYDNDHITVRCSIF